MLTFTVACLALLLTLINLLRSARWSRARQRAEEMEKAFKAERYAKLRDAINSGAIRPGRMQDDLLQELAEFKPEGPAKHQDTMDAMALAHLEGLPPKLGAMQMEHQKDVLTTIIQRTGCSLAEAAAALRQANHDLEHAVRLARNTPSQHAPGCPRRQWDRKPEHKCTCGRGQR
jgi:hypothetical protein